MATEKININDVIRRMCTKSLAGMSAASDFEKSFLSRLRSGVYSRQRFEKYINLLNYLYYDSETKNRI